MMRRTTSVVWAVRGLLAFATACGSSGSANPQNTDKGDSGSGARMGSGSGEGSGSGHGGTGSGSASGNSGTGSGSASGNSGTGSGSGGTVTPGDGCAAGLGISAGYYTCSKEYFVSPSGDDANDGISSATAKKTIGGATGLPLSAGDCVTVADGTYDETVVVSTSGSTSTCSGYVVFRAASQGGAKVVSTDPYTGFTVAASYVIVDGFDLEDTGTGSAFGAGTNTLQGGKVIVYHHIEAVRNIAHDSGGAGLGAIHSDYIRFEQNVVYDNSTRSDYGDSGIDLWEAQASDTLPGFHIVIRNNYSYLNIESDIPANLQTDGEGIIVDSFDYADATYGTTPYAQETLIENNVIWGNGGRGIEAAGAQPTSYVTIRNNTVFDNNRQQQEYPGAEIVSYGNHNAIYNNIAILGPDATNGSDGDQTYPILDNCGVSSGGVTVAGGSSWANNLVYNMKAGTALSYTSCLAGMSTIPTGTNLMGANAGLAAEMSAMMPTLQDFALPAASPAAQAGSVTSYSSFDYDYVLRPKPPSIGAFEPRL